MPWTYESRTGGRLCVTRCDDGHLQLIAVSDAGTAVAVCVAAEDAPRALDEMRGWARVPDRWQVLRKWLAGAAVIVAGLADEPDAAQKRALDAVLAKMDEMEG